MRNIFFCNYLNYKVIFNILFQLMFILFQEVKMFLMVLVKNNKPVVFSWIHV